MTELTWDDGVPLDQRTTAAPREAHGAASPASGGAPATVPAQPAVPLLDPGEIVEDFEIVRLLGRGSFAAVYLARQVSLDRLVALKVSAHSGHEARTLAKLEHDH